MTRRSGRAIERAWRQMACGAERVRSRVSRAPLRALGEIKGRRAQFERGGLLAQESGARSHAVRNLILSTLCPSDFQGSSRC